MTADFLNGTNPYFTVGPGQHNIQVVSDGTDIYVTIESDKEEASRASYDSEDVRKNPNAFSPADKARILQGEERSRRRKKKK